MMDIPTINFLRNNFSTREQNQLSLNFKNSPQLTVLRAEIGADDSPYCLRAFSIATSLHEYEDRMGSPLDWDSVEVGSNFKMSRLKYEECVTHDPFLAFTKLALTRKFSALAILDETQTAIVQKSKSAGEPLTKSEFERPFIAAHVALLRQTFTCHLFDAHHHPLRPHFGNRLRQWLPKIG